VQREHPHRIQLSRAEGWRMAANTVKVDRTTMLGGAKDSYEPFILP
jgi:hypothetical protein